MTYHAWNNADICDNCGVSKEDYMNQADWAILFCPGKSAMKTDTIRQCCGKPATIYLGGRWFCESCGTEDKTRYNKTASTILPEPPKKCVCGAWAIGSNTHSPWCEVRTSK